MDTCDHKERRNDATEKSKQKRHQQDTFRRVSSVLRRINDLLCYISLLCCFAQMAATQKSIVLEFVETRGADSTLCYKVLNSFTKIDGIEWF